MARKANNDMRSMPTTRLQKRSRRAPASPQNRSKNSVLKQHCCERRKSTSIGVSEKVTVRWSSTRDSN
eukprot:CAMPEP_0116078136 /NCGR_PEP_ID=MMETSP0327-20121206/437_1 /TAXON_ID=44447 /ORGANISM="Pseudo-nitzschia delicatissima, Strain B596" /LENGTH=67 /DNA_ID=CAMNT_0003568653 /DNA_START=265 /DNA_END=468 /DNA_ORIENTATION=-